jgi:putative NIF3 family GTP cyclohydrolase 1 type 2
MKIREIFDLAIDMGIEADPRDKKGIDKVLIRRRKEFDILPKSQKIEFNQKRLVNPYSDSQLHFGDPDLEVSKIMFGIDARTTDAILLADRLNQKGQGIDLIIGHHPMGRSFAEFVDVIELQIDMVALYGVPVNVAEALIMKGIGEVYRRIHPGNIYEVVDTAKLLNIPLMNIHTPCDNLGWKYLTDFLSQKELETVRDVINAIKEIPEYKKAVRLGMMPAVYAGNVKNRCGKIMVGGFTGGTNVSKELYIELIKAGIGTWIGMHAPEDYKKVADEHHLNVVISGHMASDSLGINLFLDELEKQGVEIVPFSGLIRVSRNK